MSRNRHQACSLSFPLRFIAEEGRIAFCSVLLLFVVTLITGASSIQAGEEISFPEWRGIPRLSLDLSQDEEPPFVKYSAPTVGTDSKKSSAIASDSKIKDSETRLQDAREEMRESLMREGESSAADRDALTAEFFSIMRWTIVALVVGGIVAVGLKRLPQFNRPPVAGTKMSVMESLSLGRHQMLNLVQAGGERFLVASDPGGIRSVTLLPNWPAGEEEQTRPEETPVKIFPPSIPENFRVSEAA